VLMIEQGCLSLADSISAVKPNADARFSVSRSLPNGHHQGISAPSGAVTELAMVIDAVVKARTFRSASGASTAVRLAQ
jgi:hypothetical protein